MAQVGRLSTCGRCAGTIAKMPVGWAHVAGMKQHIAEPDDSAVSGPDRCDPNVHAEREAEEEAQRALDEDADAYAGRMED